MFFSITELEHHKIEFDVTYAPGEIAFDNEVTQRGNLKAAGYAQLFPNTLGEIRIHGEVKVEMQAACDRCLETAIHPIDSSFDLFYRPEPRKVAHQEIRIDDGEVDVSFYKGDGVALEDALREFVFLSMPMRLICREDCKGICPSCGGDRNATPCDCASKARDSRWEALRNL